jgi:hypothetical protein
MSSRALVGIAVKVLSVPESVTMRLTPAARWTPVGPAPALLVVFSYRVAS